MAENKTRADIARLLEGLAKASGLGIAAEGRLLGGWVARGCPRQPRAHEAQCALVSPEGRCPGAPRRGPIQRRCQVRRGCEELVRLTFCSPTRRREDDLAAWAEISKMALDAILRREEELDLTARELAIAYDQLSLICELCTILQNPSSEAETAQVVLEHLAGVVPSDASVLLCSDGEGDFPKLVAARSARDRDVGLATAAAHWAVREGLLSEASQGLSVTGSELGVEGIEGELLIVSAGGVGQVHDLIVLARRDPAWAFSTAEVKLVCAAARQMALALAGARLRESLSNLFLSTVRALAAAVDAKDPYTRGHSQRVAALALAVGRELDLDGDELERLQLSALLHDVGKIAVSTEVLMKPGALDGHEWNMIKSHPTQGAEILVCVPQLAPIVQVVRYHHEHLDGSGYPEGLKGDDIPLLARIVGACDAYDAMTSARPYRGPMVPEAAMAELKAAAGTVFDPQVVEALAKVLGAEVIDLATPSAA